MQFFFGKNITEVMLCPSQLIRLKGHMTFVNLSTGDVYPDYLVRLVNASLLHCKVTVFPSITDKYLGGGYFEFMKISCFK